MDCGSLERSGHLLRLRSYGTYAIDDMGLLGTDPYDAGTIEVASTTFILVSVAGSNRCDEGTASSCGTWG